MLKILFWNINKSVDSKVIAELCFERRVDILLLAEPHQSPEYIVTDIFKRTGVYFTDFTKLSKRISIYSSLPKKSIERVYDGPWLTINHVMPVVGESFLFGGVHFASKMHKDEKDQAMNMFGLRDNIERAEQKYGHSRTLVIGDFNQNPYELGMTNAHSMHAVMSRDIAMREKRLVDHEARKFFYNPMWSLIGDESNGPPGTFYYPQCQKHTYWHMFDQVLLRPELLRTYSKGDVQVIDQIGGRSLLKGGKIDCSLSDHLPVIASILT